MPLRFTTSQSSKVKELSPLPVFSDTFSSQKESPLTVAMRGQAGWGQRQGFLGGRSGGDSMRLCPPKSTSARCAPSPAAKSVKVLQVTLIARVTRGLGDKDAGICLFSPFSLWEWGLAKGIRCPRSGMLVLQAAVESAC